ncbi:MAG: transcription antitermination factor NusB [Polyangiaceae bacterium]
MGARHSGREAALQMLFQIEASGVDADKAIALFWRNFEADPEGRPYADEVVRGIAEKGAEVDASITAASSNWRIERMTRVDRNLLRLGTWELMFRPDVPRAVVLDEAVELAKSYGTDESSAFVNGVLNQIGEKVRQNEPRREE